MLLHMAASLLAAPLLTAEPKEVREGAREDPEAGPAEQAEQREVHGPAYRESHDEEGEAGRPAERDRELPDRRPAALDRLRVAQEQAVPAGERDGVTEESRRPRRRGGRQRNPVPRRLCVPRSGCDDSRAADERKQHAAPLLRRRS